MLFRWWSIGLAIGFSAIAGRPCVGQPGPTIPGERYFAQIGVGRGGSIGFQTDFVFINSGDPTDFELDFFASDGEPLTVRIFRNNMDTATDSVVRTRLARGETLNMAIRSEGPLVAGYARLDAGPDVNGVIAFTRTDLDGPRVQYQAGVPLAPVVSDFTIPAKFVPNVGDMGFAIVNPGGGVTASQESEGDARIVFRLYDESFTFQGSVERTLPAGAHMAAFIGQLFPQIEDLAAGVGFNGSMTVESSRPLAAISVLQTNVPTLTTVPITPGRADQ